jgi:hypothetical protein
MKHLKFLISLLLVLNSLDNAKAESKLSTVLSTDDKLDFSFQNSLNCSISAPWSTSYMFLMIFNPTGVDGNCTFNTYKEIPKGTALSCSLSANSTQPTNSTLWASNFLSIDCESENIGPRSPFLG